MRACDHIGCLEMATGTCASCGDPLCACHLDEVELCPACAAFAGHLSADEAEFFEAAKAFA